MGNENSSNKTSIIKKSNTVKNISLLRNDYIQAIDRRKTLNKKLLNNINKSNSSPFNTSNVENTNNQSNTERSSLPNRDRGRTYYNIEKKKESNNDVSTYEINLEFNTSLNSCNTTRKGSQNNEEEKGNNQTNESTYQNSQMKEMRTNTITTISTTDGYTNNQSSGDLKITDKDKDNKSIGTSNGQGSTYHICNSGLKVQGSNSIMSFGLNSISSGGILNLSGRFSVDCPICEEFPYDSKSSFLNLNLPYDENNIINNNITYSPQSSTKLRNNYIAKLISSGIFNKQEQPYNNIFILDWDDTLLPTSYISEYIKSNESLKEKEKLYLAKIEFSVLRILTFALKSGADIYIVTGADKNWITASSKKYLKSIYKLIKYNPSIKLLYAKDFKNRHSDVMDNSNISNLRKTTMTMLTTNGDNNIDYNKYFDNMETEEPELNLKEKAVESIFEKYSLDALTNIIAISDSFTTLDTVVRKIKDFSKDKAFYKNLKLMDYPSIEQLNKQLGLLADQMNAIYTAVRNINIKVKINKG